MSYGGDIFKWQSFNFFLHNSMFILVPDMVAKSKWQASHIAEQQGS